MLLWFVVVIFPCLWLAVSGFKTAAEINASQNVTFFPKEFDLKKVAYAWNTLNYQKFYVNTFILAIGCVISETERLQGNTYPCVLSDDFATYRNNSTAVYNL